LNAEASISTRILGPDPTTSEACKVHPIVDPTKFWKGVGDAHVRQWKPRQKFVTTIAAIFKPKIHANALTDGAPPWTPLGELTALPDLLSGFGGWGEEGD